MITDKTLILLGASVYSVQKFEFGLYGLAAHYSHIPEAQKDKRYRNLDPEKFLRGDLSDLRATLGQIAGTFAKEFYLSGDFLDEFIDKRNIIVHRFWRLTNDRKDEALFKDPDVYLQEFIDECEQWIKILCGLLSVVSEGAAKKEGRESEYLRSETDEENLKAFTEFLGVQSLRGRVKAKSERSSVDIPEN